MAFVCVRGFAWRWKLWRTLSNMRTEREKDLWLNEWDRGRISHHKAKKKKQQQHRRQCAQTKTTIDKHTRRWGLMFGARRDLHPKHLFPCNNVMPSHQSVNDGSLNLTTTTSPKVHGGSACACTSPTGKITRGGGGHRQLSKEKMYVHYWIINNPLRSPKRWGEGET